MKFEITAVLLGVVGKKGTGKLDSGETWSTDRVELHCLTDFPESDSMAHGKTVTAYAVQDYSAHYEKAKTMLDQPVVLQMEIQSAKKLGAAPRTVCIGFHPAPPMMKKPAMENRITP